MMHIISVIYLIVMAMTLTQCVLWGVREDSKPNPEFKEMAERFWRCVEAEQRYCHPDDRG